MSHRIHRKFILSVSFLFLAVCCLCPAARGDETAKLAVDASDNVYVSAYRYGGIVSPDVAGTIKYNPAGGRIWAEACVWDRRALAVDASGNVCVAGEAQNWRSPGNNFGTFKYGPDGTELWAAF